MKKYNDYVTEVSYEYPSISEEFVNKLKAEKANACKLTGTPAEISKAVREAMAKNTDKLITATPAVVHEAVSAELEQLRGSKCA